MSEEELVLSFLLLLLAVLLSLPNLRLLHYIISNNQQPNVFDRGLALCLVTSGKWIEGRIMAHVSLFWKCVNPNKFIVMTKIIYSWSITIVLII